MNSTEHDQTAKDRVRNLLRGSHTFNRAEIDLLDAVLVKLRARAHEGDLDVLRRNPTLAALARKVKVLQRQVDERKASRGGA